jgi:hypothetical protein
MSITPVRRTYFGIAALVIGILAVFSLGVNYWVSFLRITPEQFGQLNNITVLFYCVLTPLAFALGILGLIFKNDSKALSGTALAVVTTPFVVISIQLARSILENN